MKRGPAPPGHRRERGSEAEEIAARWLRQRGWEILDRNHHCRGGEVDLVIGRGETIAFVEVRSRSGASFSHPVESVSPAKQRRILLAATHWAQARRVLHSHFLRFDVVGILFDEEGEPEILHIEGAFDAEGRAF